MAPITPNIKSTTFQGNSTITLFIYPFGSVREHFSFDYNQTTLMSTSPSSRIAEKPKPILKSHHGLEGVSVQY